MTALLPQERLTSAELTKYVFQDSAQVFERIIFSRASGMVLVQQSINVGHARSHPRGGARSVLDLHAVLFPKFLRLQYLAHIRDSIGEIEPAVHLASHNLYLFVSAAPCWLDIPFG